MRNLTDFAIKQEYERVKELGDQLVEVGKRKNWEAYRPNLEQLFDNKSDRGGRPNIDVIVMLKSLYIQHLYSLSDEQLERELADRISFRVFLDTTKVIPDSTTIWKFKEHLANSGKDIKIWNDLQRQLRHHESESQEGYHPGCHFHRGRSWSRPEDTPRGD